MIIRECCSDCNEDAVIEVHAESYLDACGTIILTYWKRCWACGAQTEKTKEINPEDL